MTIVLGAHALIDIALPTGTDPNEIMRFQLEKGLSDEQAISMAATLIGDVNTQLAQQYGGLIRFTTESYARYRQGASTRTMTPRAAEFSRSDAIRSDDIGHMLPRNDFEDSIEWSKIFQRRADPELLRYSLETIAERWRNRVDFDIWTRALTNTENQIGTGSGYDVGWAIGTGTNVNYIPPQWRGNIFSTSHTHYRFFDDNSLNWDNAFEEGMEELRHHGVTGTLTIYVSQDDVGEVTVLSNFAALEPTVVQLVGGNTSSPVIYGRGNIEGVPGELIGYYRSRQWGLAEIRYHERIPTNYAFVTKSFGIDHPNNPFAVRIDPIGFGLKVEAEVTNSLTPKVKGLMFNATHGVGVNNRLHGVALYLNAGAASWANPTIS